MDLVTLALAKAYTKKSLEGKGAIKGKDGASVVSVGITADNHLVTTLSDGSTKDAGVVPTAKGDKGDTGAQGLQGEKGDKGDKGDDGAQGVQGEQGAQGENGADGFSPTVEVKESTESRYVLTVTDKNGSFDTPNLKGSGGGGGGGITDYSDLSNKPSINGTTLEGNKTLTQLGIAGADDLSALQTTVASKADTATTDELSDRVTALEEKPDVNPTQMETMPTASADYNIVQYVGVDTANYKRGFFYRSTPSVVSGNVVYNWEQIDVQPSSADYDALSNKPQINGIELDGDKSAAQLKLQSTLQYSTLPTADATNLGQIVQYIGATTTDYVQGYFYQCAYDSETTSYKWVYKASSSDTTARVTALETAIGDTSDLQKPTIVESINALARHDIKTVTYEEPNLVITYNDDTTATVNLLQVLNETQIGELSNVIDTTIADADVLQYDAALKAYKPYAVVTAIANCLQAAKDYADQAVSESVVAGAFVCDSKPEYDAENDTVIYKQDGVTKTTTQTDARFYYHDSEGQSFCSSWINDIEFTFSVAEVEFSDYVKVENLVSTYTGEEADKTKVPTLAALDALVTLIRTSYLADVLHTSDVVDSLTSQDSEKPLSANQGKVLKASIDTKQDIIQVSVLPTADSSRLNQVLQTVPNGKWWRCEYDSEADSYSWVEVKYSPTMDTALNEDSTNPVTNRAITLSLNEKESGLQSQIDDITDDVDALGNNLAAEATSRQNADNNILLQLNTLKGVAMTMYASESLLPSAIDFENGVVVAVGEIAWCVAEKTWHRVSAVNSETLAITWADYDPHIQADIDLSKYSKNLIIDKAENITDAQKEEYDTFDTSDEAGEGTMVFGEVAEGDHNAVDGDSVYKATVHRVIPDITFGQVSIANNKTLGTTSTITYTPTTNGIFTAYGLKAGSGNSVAIKKGTSADYTVSEIVGRWDDYPAPLPEGVTTTDAALHTWYIQCYAEKGTTYSLVTNAVGLYTLINWAFQPTL